MKKLMLLAFLAFGMMANAQDFHVLHIEDIESYQIIEFCEGESVVVYGEEGCDRCEWKINGEFLYADSIVVTQTGYADLKYYGCNINERNFMISIQPSYVENPFDEPVIWKRAGEAVTLIGQPWFNNQWSTGENTDTISVLEPGVYTVTISDLCGEGTYSVEVRDNVEIYRTTTDLRSNLNMVTWHTGLDYFESVNVYRNNQLVATVPYADGQFVDNIGSEATQWQYHICGVLSGREECPIKSYWKRTIHTWESVDGQGNCNLNWTSYEGEDGEEATAYRIFDYTNDELVLKMEVGNFTNSFTYNPADYDGYGVVGAVFANKSEEDLSLSNHTSDVLAVGEQQQEKVSVYPNPAHGQFTVSGTGKVVISNALGQTVKEMEIDGKQMIELPAGMYFVQVNGSVKKVVVE